LAGRTDIEIVTPWTRLDSILNVNSEGTPELLFIELDKPSLPLPLRCLLAAAIPLRIIALSADGRRATVFGVNEQRNVLEGQSAGELWNFLEGGAP
jgi:hypothetical protein